MSDYMQEAVAKAIYGTNTGEILEAAPWHMLSYSIKEDYRAEAKAAIAAMSDCMNLIHCNNISFGLNEIALNIRSWISYTEHVWKRNKVDEDARIHFPMDPGYHQMKIWLETMDAAVAKTASNPPHDGKDYQDD